MTYLRNLVICTYRAQHPDILDPSEERLEKFDESLRKKFDDEVRNQADTNSIAKTDFNLSMLVFFAAQSTATTVVTQVKHACKFFLAVAPTP
jgi:hypothetical protein